MNLGASQALGIGILNEVMTGVDVGGRVGEGKRERREGRETIGVTKTGVARLSGGQKACTQGGCDGEAS